MTPRRWRKLRGLFSKAGKLNGPDRTAYLEEACGTDVALRRDVESLLAYGDKSDAFLGIVSTGGRQTILHYRIHRRIGEGGMGLVYQAWDLKLERWVAIKFLPPWMVTDPRGRKLLMDEARHASALNHPNIVTIYEVAQAPGVDFIVMELITGKTLRELIPTTGLPVPRALGYGIAIGEALIRAHEHGLVHRDLKPSNIMVTDEGRVKLLDFGLAMPKGNALDLDGGQPFGTEFYMAPEQLSGGHTDHRTDIFALGLVLGEMLTGRHLLKPRQPTASPSIPLKTLVRSLAKRIPAPLSHAIGRCVEADPAIRFQTVADLVTALNQCLLDARGTANSLREIVGESSATGTDPRVLTVRAHLASLSYESAMESRSAVDGVRAILVRTRSKAVRAEVISATKALLTGDESFRKGFLANSARPVRNMALELLRLATRDDLRSYVKTNEFEHLDLYEMDFTGLDLKGFQFKGGFLVSSRFDGSDLRGAGFEGAAIRNVNFGGAKLVDADFTGADWWNALGLDAQQLQSAKMATFARCPISVAGMHEFLTARYAVAFAAWDTAVQQELQAAWSDYLKPGGLRELVNGQK